MKDPVSPPLLRIAGLTLLGIAFPATSQAVVSSGLTAYWSFDTNLNDQAVGLLLGASTTADNGNLTGTGATLDNAGRFGKAYRGTGGTSTGKAVFPLTNDISNVANGSVSVSLWFKATGALSNFAALAAVGENNAWRIARDGGATPLKYAYAGGNNGDIKSTSTFGNAGSPVQVWNHLVAVTEKNVGTRFYVNGVLEATRNVAPILTTDNKTEFWIGNNPGATTRPWNGFIDDFGIWNRALTQAEITQIYNEGNNNNSLSVILTAENLDTDGDGLVDAWEIANLPAGAQLDSGSVNPAFGPNGDPDGDSSINSQEFVQKTLPQVFDTDGDGARDGYETNTGIYVSPTNLGSKPLVADTDGDELLDGVESGTGIFVSLATDTGTNPLLADTDGDGFNDPTEFANNTNPSLNTSVPTIPGLPITDNFSDGLFDNTRWTRAINIPQGGVVVQEIGGHIKLAGRGHLNTRSEFNPEDPSIGGIYITGKWTFRSIEDFIQIITRSTGTPAGDYGETSGGLEFYIEQTSTNPTIRGRVEADFAVSQLTQTGKIKLEKDKTYDFIIIDNGLAKDGFVSFRLTESGNPLNTVCVSGFLTSATSTNNFVTFHNREGGDKSAELDDVTIGKMTDGDSDGLPDFWEIANGLNPAAANTGDSDSDGADDTIEYAQGTKPTVADTDGDGAPDGSETKSHAFTDLTDRGTDPLIRDSDNDLLLDGVETDTSVYASPTDTGTDPNIVDSDGDFIGDGVEMHVGLNPSDALDTSALGKGLVSYWSFDNTLADTVHGSGIGMSLTADVGHFTGAPDVGFDAAGRFGPGLLLNGGAGYVTVPKSQDTIGGHITNSVSISLWAKVNAWDTEWQTIAGQGEGNRWRIARSGNDTTIYYNGGLPDGSGTTAFPAPTEWVHIVASSSSGVGIRLWVNGQLEMSKIEDSLLDNILANALDMQIGANPDAPNREFEGYIDDMAIWNRALTEAEVQALYTAGIAPTPQSLGGLLGIVVTNTYANWIAGYSVGALTGFEDDADGDGIENGVENLLGTNPAVANAGLTEVAKNGNVVTFQHPSNANPAADVSAVYQWSSNLTTWNGSGANVGGTTVTIVPAQNSPTAGTTTVTATITGTASPRIYLRLAATQG